jgi:tetratricopeptide (TPR) repeat protein
MPRIATAHLYLALLALTVAAYGPVWRNDFVDFDDELYITNNPRVTDGLSASGAAWALTTYHGHYWQPLSWLSLQFDAHFFSGRSPDGQRVLSRVIHGESLLWHTASVLLLFGLWQRLTGARWRSFLLAALFAVHPLHVESVAWAAERKDVLSVFFGVLALWAYIRYAEAPGWKPYLAVMAAFLLSLMAKPMLMTLPFVLLLLDYWPLQRLKSEIGNPNAEIRNPKRRGFGSLGFRAWDFLRISDFRFRILEKVPLLLVAGAVAVVTVLARQQTGAPIPLSDIPVSARIGNGLAAYGWYVAHSLVPARLCVLYPHPMRDWSVLSALAGAGLLLGVTLLAAWQARRRPWFVVGWLWFVGTLLPVIGLFQGGVQAWADRFTYWPHVGLFLVAVWGLAELAQRWRVPARLAGAAAALALGGFAALTWVQVGYWHDSTALWERALAVTENNHRAHLLLGKYCLGQGRLDEAASHLGEAVRIYPESSEHYYALGVALLTLGRLEEADAQFRHVLGRDPGRADAWHDLGIVELRLGKPDRAVRCFRRILEPEPDSADALAMMGQALWRQGRRAEALEALRQALAHDPRQADAWHGLGTAHLAQERPTEAIEALQEALRLKPALVSVRSELGVALGRLGRWAEAASCQWDAVRMQEDGERQLAAMGGRAPAPEGIPPLVIYQCRLAYALHYCGQHRAVAEFYRAAGQREPRWPEEFAAKAWRLATDPDPDRRDLQQACELAEQAVAGVADPSAHLLDALAAALAARGDFEEAVRTGQSALDKATAAGDATLAGGIRDRLALYRGHKPIVGSCP